MRRAASRPTVASILALLWLLGFAIGVPTTLSGQSGSEAQADEADTPAPAETLEADMDLRPSVTYGFDGIGKPGRWNPVVVRVSNLGDAVHGDIRLRSVQGRRTSEIRHPYEIRRELHIPKGGGSLLRFLLPIGSPALPIRIAIRHEGRIIHEEEIDANARTAPEALVVSLSEGRVLEALLTDPAPDADTGETDADGIRFRASAPVNVAYPLPEFLPEHWAGYHGVDLFFLGSAPLQRLSNSQWRAIENWITRGGALVMTTPGAGAPAAGRAEGLWERAVHDRDAGGNELAELRRLGEGVVYRLGTNERALARSGIAAAFQDFIRELAVSRAERQAGPDLPVLADRDPFSDPINQELLDGPVYSYPSRWLIAVALLAYIASFAAVTRGIQRGTPGLIPALIFVPLMVGAAFYLVLFLANPPPRNALIEVQRVSGSTESPMVTLNRDVLALAAKEHSFALYPPRGSVMVPVEGSDTLLSIEREERVLHGRLSRWEERHYFLSDRIRSPLRVAHRGDANGGAVAVANDSGYLMEHLYLVFRERIYDLGPLSSEQVARRRYEAARPVDWGEVAEAHRRILERRRSALGPRGGAAREEALLIAITGRIAPTSAAEPDFDRAYSAAVVELRVPLATESETSSGNEAGGDGGDGGAASRDSGREEP